VESRSQFDNARVWNICAAVVVLGLALTSAVQDCVHRSNVNSPPGVPIDFPHYYMAGKLARTGPPENFLYYPPRDHVARSYTELRIDATTPYGGASDRGGLPNGAVTLPFDAPPFSAVVMGALASLGWKTAYFVWQLLGALMMMASVYLALRLFQGEPPSVLLVAVCFAVAFLFLPFKRALTFGNIDVLLLLLWVVGVFLLSRGRAIPSALCLALGSAIKLSPVYAVPLFALRRQWRWLFAYGAWSVLLLAASVWGVGWRNHVLWAGQVAPALSGGIKSIGNRSLAGLVYALSDSGRLLTQLPTPQGWSLLMKAVSAIGYSTFLFWCWRKRRDSRCLVLEITLLPLIVLLISPISWSQYWVLAVLPLVFLWVHSRRQSMAASRLDLIILTCGTLIVGATAPEYYIVLALGTAGALLIMGSWVLATLGFLWVGMRMYEDFSVNKRDCEFERGERSGLSVPVASVSA
jgi:hypothetical protein